MNHNVRRGSLKHQIADEIRRSIFRGELMPNDKVTEKQLSAYFDVSRGPVREAMQLLVMEGLLVSTTYKETKVASITTEEVTELLVPIRINIETFALKHAYPSWDEQNFKAFEKILEQMERAEVFNDTQLFSELDQRFHELIIRSSNMVNVENFWDGVLSRIRLLFVYQNNLSMNLQNFVESHRVLLDVFKSGDLDESVQKLQEHIVKANTPVT
ncbi:GntR family transcriptional regulator [Lentibacillus lipolyticus]|nr:GntR family transcriptional regulator [Lentibacillus lipolyticus]